MATSAILLGLIAFSCFQVQARDDVETEFIKEMYVLHSILTFKGVTPQTFHIVADLQLDEYEQGMNTLKSRANYKLEKLNVTKTCANKAAALLEFSSDIRERIADCFRENIKRNEKVTYKAREVLSGKFMGYYEELTGRFLACQDVKCRKETTAEVTNTRTNTYHEEDELLKEQDDNTVRDGCLNKCRMDYKRWAKVVIKAAKKCDLST